MRPAEMVLTLHDALDLVGTLDDAPREDLV